jgi:hypothetical protein
MRARSRQGLIALNLALLTILAIMTFSPLAEGQPGASRARGQYSMVSGEITGGTPHVVYIFDSNNREMVAVRWNNSRRTLDGIGFRDLNADSKAVNQGGPR